MSESRVALVTGANRGIGLEVCRQLAARGFHVVLTARHQEDAERAAGTIRAAGTGSVIPARLDVTDAASIGALADDLSGRRLSVDVLVNNAGILVNEDDGALEMTTHDVRATLETNVIGAIAVSQAFVPGMIERGYGRVVNVSSEAGQLASMETYAPAYSISKAALNAFTRQLAGETRGTDVLVNSACPGWVRTDMGGPGAPKSVEEGADTIIWLATLAASSPTGGFFSDRRKIEW
jgi:NAD(P)-dependent dehydrogenase (short-subunit alcohol dehydrogenase family)